MNQVPSRYGSGLHIFYAAYSDCAQRVLLCAAEKGIEATLHPVDLRRNAQLADWFLEITPKCEVPAIVHEGMPMHDSCRILRYFDEKFPHPCLTPGDKGEREEMNRLLQDASSFHTTGVIEYVYAKGIGRLPRPQDWAFYRANVPHRLAFHEARLRGERGCDLAGTEAHLQDVYAGLEGRLRGNRWLAGSVYSLADIAWFPSISLMEVFGHSCANFPELSAWLDRIRSRPAYTSGIGRHLLPIPDVLLRTVARLNNRFGNRR